MEAKSVLEKFHQQRRLLNNLRENMATPRLKGMWNFLNSKAEMVSIIYKVPTIEHLVAKAGPNKPIDAATYDEIVGVGLYIMRKCSKSNDHVNLIINHLGLGLKSTNKNENQTYVNELMEGFINPALDFIEDKLEELVTKESKQKSTESNPSEIAEAKENEKKCIRIIAKWFRENKRIVNRSEAIKEFGVNDDRYEVLIRILEHNGVVEKVESNMREGYASHFRPTAYAEELAREFDAEENETNQKNKTLEHTSLQNEFIKFLENKKMFPPETIWINEKGGVPDLSIIEVPTNRLLLLIEFKNSNNNSVLGRTSLQLQEYRRKEGQEECLAYIVCQSLDKSSEPFEICKVSDNGYESILINDFPTYEELRRKRGKATEASGGEDGDDEDYRNVFHENFIAFLVNEKKFPRESLNHGISAEDPLIDLTVTNPDTNKFLAIFSFSKTEIDTISFRKPSEILTKVHKVGSVGKYNPFLYTVYRSGESNEGFMILEVEDDETSNEISYGDFPTYNQLLFASPLSNKGRRICWALTRLAKDEHRFSVDAPCEDYINLQIKKNVRTAAQIHRINDSDENIALILAGYQKDFPEAKLPTYMFRGEVQQLSGYTNKYPGERNWLEGNLGHQQLKYKAGVYILRPGSLALGDVENEAGGLLELAKKNAERDKEPEEKNISRYGKGHIVTIQMDKLSDIDLLGRDKLVKAFAGMFVHTQEVEGFTVALLGDWGEGKSTMMKLLEKRLNEKHPGRFDFATFNAWEYEHTDNIAAGLSQEVVKGLKCKWNIWKNIILLLCFIVREHWKGLLIKTLYLMIPGAVILSMYYLKVLPAEYYQYLHYGFWGVLFFASIYIFKNAKFIFEHPLLTSMETYLRLPDYGKHLGLIPVLKRQIKILCKLKLDAIRILKFKWGKDRKLIVFVDDLDRCKTDCIARVLDAIRLVMSIPNVIVMIGIDYRIAFKAMENYYEKLGDEERNKSDIARDYLGKIIQLPVRLVPSGPEEVRKYIEKRLFPDAQVMEDIKKDVEIDKERDIIEPPKTKKEIIEAEREDIGDRIPDDKKVEEPKSVEEILKDTTIERDMFSDLAQRFNFTNPRQLLRLRNSYRFLKVMDSDEKYDREILMKILFWQEFLNNWPSIIRDQCEKSVTKQESLEKIEKPEAKQIVQDVREDILKIVEIPMYEEIERFVHIVVLPHSEGRILDTR